MRPTLTALGLSAVMALPAAALDLTDLSDGERDALRSEMRAYLLDNPEVLLDAMAVLEQREAAARAQADTALVQANADALFDSPADWVGGNPEGDVAMVEFIDYRCGYCKRAHPEVSALLEEDGNIRLIRKELPILGEQSILAAQFAIAVKTVAGDAAYGDVSEALIALRSDVTADSLAQMATTFDLPADDIMAEMDSEATTAIIRENQLLAMRLHIQGTPAFVIGGELVRGYVPQDQMAAIVAQARAD